LFVGKILEISVLCSGAAKAAVTALRPLLERASGRSVVLSFATTGVIVKRIAAGEPIDLLISASDSIDIMTKAGHVIAGSAVEIAKSGVGVVVAKGATKPDIATPDALRAALLRARQVAYTNPAAGGASGVQVAAVLEQLGIAEQIDAKAIFGEGGPIALIVARGEAELGMHQIPELLGHDGVDYIGSLPATLQAYTRVSAAIPSRANAPDEAKRLIASLRSDEAAAVMHSCGMQPS
jgi:molybdate transport system substrate-binding protein